MVAGGTKRSSGMRIHIGMVSVDPITGLFSQRDARALMLHYVAYAGSETIPATLIFPVRSLDVLSGHPNATFLLTTWKHVFIPG